MLVWRLRRALPSIFHCQYLCQTPSLDGETLLTCHDGRLDSNGMITAMCIVHIPVTDDAGSSRRDDAALASHEWQRVASGSGATGVGLQLARCTSGTAYFQSAGRGVLPCRGIAGQHGLLEPEACSDDSASAFSRARAAEGSALWRRLSSSAPPGWDAVRACIRAAAAGAAGRAWLKRSRRFGLDASPDMLAFWKSIQCGTASM